MLSHQNTYQASPPDLQVSSFSTGPPPTEEVEIMSGLVLKMFSGPGRPTAHSKGLIWNSEQHLGTIPVCACNFQSHPEGVWWSGEAYRQISLRTPSRPEVTGMNWKPRPGDVLKPKRCWEASMVGQKMLCPWIKRAHCTYIFLINYNY